jgi:hypothetical protein
MSEKKWRNVSEKKYQIDIDGSYVDVLVPYAKVEKIVEAFFANGGMMSEQGQMITSVPTLIKNFGVLGDILRSEYDSKGVMTKDVGCRDLSASEVTALFEVASDIIAGFMSAITATTEEPESETETSSVVAK